MKDFEVINNCSLCNSNSLKEVISFGKTPLANELFIDAQQVYDLFDLTVMYCNDCGHCQLKTFVNEERLYRNYVYVSGTNANNVLHFKSYAEKIMNEFFSDRFKRKLNEDNNLVIEIASNDGTFLKWFDGNIKKIGVDPAINLVAEAAKNGVINIPVFFNEETANNEISKACDNSKAQVIVANNVFAHNKDLDSIVKGVKFLLDDNGTFIFENSYLLDVLDKGLFDIFYHEHMHEHSITPLVKYFKKFDMDIYRVERLPNHGGSIRVYACNSNFKPIESSVNELLELEKEIPIKLEVFKNNISELKDKLVNEVDRLKSENKTIGVLGFPAKAMTLLHYFKLNKKIDFIYDDNILKQGMFVPGTNLSIRETNNIYNVCMPDVLIVLGWNFIDSFIKNHKNYIGEWIVPLPEYKKFKITYCMEKSYE